MVRLNDCWDSTTAGILEAFDTEERLGRDDCTFRACKPTLCATGNEVALLALTNEL